VTYQRKEVIGAATLYLGDCREVLPTLEPVDALVTDPPYGTRDDEWDDMSEREFARFSMSWLGMAAVKAPEAILFGNIDNAVQRLAQMIYPRVRPMIWSKPPGSQLSGASERGRWFAFETIFHCFDPQDVGGVVARHITNARKAAGLTRSGVDMIVRGKKTGLCYRWEEGACLPTAEQVALMKGELQFAPSFDADLESEYAARADVASRFDVLTYRTVTEGRHPCEKPVGLMTDILLTTGPKWRSLLDPFMGSGSTGVAAVQEGRSFIGIEQDPAYFDIACRRIEQAQRQGNLF